jgi:pimeloyl-ACP methyl ester carboxylesterase
MPLYKKGAVSIHYEEAGSGFPLLVIPGGGLNSTIAGLSRSVPFNPMVEFKSEYRCIAADLRNAVEGQSAGPLEIDRPWDAYTDDHLGLMDHLGIDKFMVLGFCIGGPFIWNLIKRAPNRIVAAVLAQPSGSRPEMRDLFYDGNMKGWGPALSAKRPEITMQMVDKFLTKMYRTDADFVFTVTRDFVRSCQTPVLILPDDIPQHPYAVAMESAMLAPNAEVSMFPWKEPKERIPLAVRQIRSFLRAHRPVEATHRITSAAAG